MLRFVGFLRVALQILDRNSGMNDATMQLHHGLFNTSPNHWAPLILSLPINALQVMHNDRLQTLCAFP